MIDINAQLYTEIARAIKAKFPDATVSDEYVHAPSSFPFVTIEEMDNYAMRLDSATTEKYAGLTYDVNVYSNRSSGKKQMCRRIMKFIDDMMLAKNFTRFSMTPVPNLESATVYRLTARYRAATDGENIYRR